MKKNTEVVKLLRIIIGTLNDLSEPEYEQLLNGEGRLQFAVQTKKSRSIQKEDSKVSSEDLQALLNALSLSKTREEAREVINKDLRMQLKDNLEKLARLLNIHINKHDKRDTIEIKIIESVIGVKLRSQAIRDLNLKGS